MTRQEIAKMFYMIKAAYPNTFGEYGQTEINNYIDAWCMVFADIPADQAYAGLKTYLSTETKGFPPSPGQIMDCVHKLNPDKIPNEMEAWSLVDKAVRNSNYNAEEEFEKLPQIVRRAIRNPARLREWAQMDEADYQTVEQSNFLRTYRAEVERERTTMRIPHDIRPQLEMIPDPERRIETKVEVERGKAPDEAIEELIQKLRGA